MFYYAVALVDCVIEGAFESGTQATSTQGKGTYLSITVQVPLALLCVIATRMGEIDRRIMHRRIAIQHVVVIRHT